MTMATLPLIIINRPTLALRPAPIFRPLELEISLSILPYTL